MFLATGQIIEVYSGSGQIVRSIKLKRAFVEKVCFVAKLNKSLADYIL